MLSFRTLAVLLVALLVPSSAFAQGSFNQVAITGESAPGVTDGAEFDFFSSPSVNAPGDVAFQGFLQGEMVSFANNNICLLYTSPSPRDLSTSRMPSSA